MAGITGLGSGWSLKKETTWGTAATPDRSLPFLSESLDHKIDRITARTLKGGNYLDTSSSWRPGAQHVEGDVQTLLYDSGATLLWEAMLGQVTTTGTGPYTHTAAIKADGTLPSYTMEINLGGTTSSNVQKKVTGAKVGSWELKLAVNELATLGLTWVGKTMTRALAALDGTAPAAQKPFVYVDGQITGSGQPVGCIQGITISGNNNLQSGNDLMCLGTTAINEPAAARRAITGSMDILFNGTVTNYGLFTSGSEYGLVLTCTSGSNTLTITSNVRYDGETTNVGGEDTIKTAMPFTVLAPTTDASGFTVVAVNSDAVP